MAAVRTTNQGARRWWLTAVMALVGGLAGLGYAVLEAPTYTATAYVVVVKVNPEDNTSAVSYAQAYARLVRQGEVVSAATTASGGTATVSELRSSVRASASPDTPVIEVSGSAGTAERAADLSNLVAEGLVSTGKAQAPSTRMNLVLLSPAYPPPEPSSPRPVLSIAIGMVVGFLLGSLFLLFRPADGGRPGLDPDRTAVLMQHPDDRGRFDDTTMSRRTDDLLRESS